MKNGPRNLGASLKAINRLKRAFEGWWKQYGSDDEEDKDPDCYAFSAGWKARSKRQQRRVINDDAAAAEIQRLREALTLLEDVVGHEDREVLAKWVAQLLAGKTLTLKEVELQIDIEGQRVNDENHHFVAEYRKKYGLGPNDPITGNEGHSDTGAEHGK